MGSLSKGLLGALGALMLLALCLSLVTIQSCSSNITDASEPPGDDAGPPSIGTCDNVGVVYDDNPFSGWPVQGGVNWGFVTAYYCDPEYLAAFGVNHWGIDLGYPIGTPVRATADGQIIAAGWHDEMGFYVRLCVDEWCATYMHLSSIAVEPGASVGSGSVLGEVGNTGNSTGPHLHYQINDPNWNTVDPAPTMG